MTWYKAAHEFSVKTRAKFSSQQQQTSLSCSRSEGGLSGQSIDNFGIVKMVQK